jgi:hypothetical protein
MEFLDMEKFTSILCCLKDDGTKDKPWGAPSGNLHTVRNHHYRRGGIAGFLRGGIFGFIREGTKGAAFFLDGTAGAALLRTGTAGAALLRTGTGGAAVLRAGTNGAATGCTGTAGAAGAAGPIRGTVGPNESSDSTVEFLPTVSSFIIFRGSRRA